MNTPYVATPDESGSNYYKFSGGVLGNLASKVVDGAEILMAAAELIQVRDAIDRAIPRDDVEAVSRAYEIGKSDGKAAAAEDGHDRGYAAGYDCDYYEGKAEAEGQGTSDYQGQYEVTSVNGGNVFITVYTREVND